MAQDPEYPYTIEFYDEPDTHRQPVWDWLRDLNPLLRSALGTAMREVLQRYGVEVCQGEWGRQLGQGLFEFRVRHDSAEVVKMFTARTPRPVPAHGKITLRVFGHAHGNKLLLLLAGYDKAADATQRREDEEIELARKRLTEYRARQRRQSGH